MYQMTLIPIHIQIRQILHHPNHLTCRTPGMLDAKKITCKKHWSKTRRTYHIKKCAILIAKLLKAAYNSKAKKFKLDEDPLQ